MTVIAEKYINHLRKMPITDRLEIIRWIETHQDELSKESSLSPDWINDDLETIGAESFFDDWTEDEEKIWSSFYQQTQNQ
jgi:hypothetical protein